MLTPVIDMKITGIKNIGDLYYIVYKMYRLTGLICSRFSPRLLGTQKTNLIKIRSLHFLQWKLQNNQKKID
jgi:phosphoribosylanthranilate isomerase